MAGIWQHRIVFSIQMGNNIKDWFCLPCVDGIRKNDEGGLIVYLKDVVRYGLLCEGLSLASVDDSWLCRDEEDRWWLLHKAEYDALGEDRHVTLLPNKQTQRQILAIKVAEKMKREFEAMSPEEQEALYNQYPGLFIMTKDTEE